MNSETLTKYGRWYLMVVNLLFHLLGNFAFIYGVMVLVANTNRNQILELIELVMGGLVLAFASLIGYAGARKQNAQLLKLYVWVLSIYTVVKITCYIISLVIRGHGTYSITEIRSSFDYYNFDLSSRELVDLLQSSHKCCGYYAPGHMKQPDGTYPPSCCVSETTCYQPYSAGCQTQVIISLGFAILFHIELFLQIFSFVVAFYLFVSIQRKRREIAISDNNL